MIPTRRGMGCGPGAIRKWNRKMNEHCSGYSRPFTSAVLQAISKHVVWIAHRAGPAGARNVRVAASSRKPKLFLGLRARAVDLAAGRHSMMMRMGCFPKGEPCDIFAPIRFPSGGIAVSHLKQPAGQAPSGGPQRGADVAGRRGHGFSHSLSQGVCRR